MNMSHIFGWIFVFLLVCMLVNFWLANNSVSDVDEDEILRNHK